MKFANLKVGTRLSIGFAVLLVISLALGALSWMRMSQLDDVVNQITNEDWEKARITLEMEIRTRDNAFKAARVMLAGNDAETIDRLKAEMSANTAKNTE